MLFSRIGIEMIASFYLGFIAATAVILGYAKYNNGIRL